MVVELRTWHTHHKHNPISAEDVPLYLNYTKLTKSFLDQAGIHWLYHFLLNCSWQMNFGRESYHFHLFIKEWVHQTPINSLKPQVTETTWVRICGSQNKSHEFSKFVKSIKKSNKKIIFKHVRNNWSL